MAKKQKKLTKDEKTDSETVEIIRINERQKTLRYLILSVAGCVALYLITDSITTIANNPESAWLKLGLALLSPAIIGWYPLHRIIKWVRGHIKWQTDRTRRIEQSVDEQRSSSELRKDGTLPND